MIPALSSRLGFTAAQRLRTPEEYKRVYDLRRSVGDDCLLLFAAWNELGRTRLGTSVSKKVGNSVVRHHWKRLIREAFRLQQHELPTGLDLIVLPRARSETIELPAVQASLKTLLARTVRKWPRPGPA